MWPLFRTGRILTIQERLDIEENAYLLHRGRDCDEIGTLCTHGQAAVSSAMLGGSLRGNHRG
jgi:hypothetical protein